MWEGTTLPNTDGPVYPGMEARPSTGAGIVYKGDSANRSFSLGKCGHPSWRAA